jgi:hypothetical protein
MQVHSFTRYATLAALVVALACARNPEQEEGATPEEAAAARDTVTDTLAADTLAAERDTAADTLGQNPPGYRGMERDTTLVPPQEGAPSDTFLQQQGQGTPQDTAGYTGLERPDTTGQAQPGQTDTTGVTDDTTGALRDTSGMTGDTAQTGQPTDTAGTSQGGDTTGYDQSQQSQDTTSR